MRVRIALLLVVALLALAACGGSEGQAPAGGTGGQTPASGAGGQAPAGQTTVPQGDASAGEQLFNQTSIGDNNAPGCVTCHSVEEGKQVVGPSLAHIATQAAQTVESSDYTGSAQDAAGFIRESIVQPDAFVAEGFGPGIMYPNYGQDLSEEQINNLVAYMMTLK